VKGRDGRVRRGAHPPLVITRTPQNTHVTFASTGAPETPEECLHRTAASGQKDQCRSALGGLYKKHIEQQVLLEERSADDTFVSVVQDAVNDTCGAGTTPLQDAVLCVDARDRSFGPRPEDAETEELEALPYRVSCVEAPETE
jgi:hypothetical protein